MKDPKKESIFSLHVLKDDDGLILGVVLLLLAILTLGGISAVSNTILEVQIAANDQLHKSAFYNAECGIYGTSKLVSNTIDIMSEPIVGNNTGSIATGVDYLPNDGNYVSDTFYHQVLGYDNYDGGDKDITLAPGGITVEVDVERRGSQHLAGGGAEFASGSDGIGSGSAGGIAVFYGINAEGRGPKSSASNITAEYRKVISLSGGM